MLFDPDYAEPVSTLVRNPCYSRQVTYLSEDKPLFDILNEFQTGKSRWSCHEFLGVLGTDQGVPTKKRGWGCPIDNIFYGASPEVPPSVAGMRFLYIVGQ